MSRIVSVEYQRNGRVANVRFDFSDRNTFTVSRVKALIDAAAQVVERRSVRCIIFSSGCDGYFSDGFSLAEMFGASTRKELGQKQWRRYEDVVRAYRRLIEIPIPTVTFVDGLCRGAGLEWALSTDFIVATERSEFGLHEVRLGIVPGLGGLGMIRQRVRYNMAHFHLLSGEPLDAAEALAAGLIDHIARGLQDYIAEGITPITRHARSALIRTKTFLRTTPEKLEALAESKEGFIQSLKDRVLRTLDE